MLYWILKVLVWVSLQLYFRKIFIEGADRIPADKPVILAANHQSAFIEPTVLACYQKHPIHFMTRGDVFVKNFMWFFRSTNQIPIYRFKDGFGNIRKNRDTFSACYDVLSKQQKILIFAQPGVVWEKRIAPVQRGAARMATGAIKEFPDLDPYILPVGINFTDHTKFNSLVMAKFGTPIRVRDYFTGVDADRRNVEETITKEIGNQFRDLIVHIDDPEDEPEVEFLLQMKEQNLDSSIVRKIERSSALLDQQIRTALNYNTLLDKSEWKEKIRKYSQALEELGISDISAKIPTATKAYFNVLVAILCFPLFLVSALFHAIPYFLGKYLSETMMKTPEFISSLRVHLSGIFFFVQLFGLMTYALVVNDYALAFKLPIFSLASVLFCQWYLLFQSRVFSDVKFLRIPIEMRTQLISLRNELDEKFD